MRHMLVAGNQLQALPPRIYKRRVSLEPTLGQDAPSSAPLRDRIPGSLSQYPRHTFIVRCYILGSLRTYYHIHGTYVSLGLGQDKYILHSHRLVECTSPQETPSRWPVGLHLTILGHMPVTTNHGYV